jgi:outer membrane lipoprotein LolB
MKIQLVIIASCAILAGCAYQPPIKTESAADWQQHRSQVAKLNQWQLQGKLGFTSMDTGGSANLVWEQNQQQYKLHLSGPFGAGSAVIAGNQDLAQLQQGDSTYTDNPSSLALQLTGLPIPVEALSWWARGLPSPSKTEATDLITSPEGYALSFAQGGWQLSFSRHQNSPNGDIPGKISGQLGDQRFKLVISRWTFPQN